jgi:hypothetical protein
MFLKVCNLIWARLWRYEEENLNLDINEGLHWPLKLGKSDRYPVTSSTILSPLSPYSQPSSVQPGNTRTASPQQEESPVINLFWAWARQEEEGEATEFASEDVCVWFLWSVTKRRRRQKWERWWKKNSSVESGLCCMESNHLGGFQICVSWWCDSLFVSCCHQLASEPYKKCQVCRNPQLPQREQASTISLHKLLLLLFLLWKGILGASV